METSNLDVWESGEPIAENETPLQEDSETGAVELETEGEETETEGEETETEEKDKAGEEEEKEEDSEEDLIAFVKKATENKKDVSKQIRSLKLPDGKITKVPDIAEMEIRVGGKDKTVSVQDLVTAYNSQNESRRLHIEVKQQKAKLEEQAQGFEQVIKDFGEEVSKGNVNQALSGLIKRAGMNPLPIMKSLRESLAEYALSYHSMSDEQKQLLDVEEEKEYNKRELAQVHEEQKLQKERDAAIQQIQNVMPQYGITTIEEFGDAYRELTQLVASGQVSIKEVKSITPQNVGEYFTYKKDCSLVNEVAKEVNPNLLQQKDTLRHILNYVQTKRPTREQLMAAVKKAYGTEAEALGGVVAEQIANKKLKGRGKKLAAETEELPQKNRSDASGKLREFVW